MKYQRKAVHAVAQAGRLRPVVEDVAEMAAAAAAVNFGPQHPKSTVFGLADGVLERLIKTRPAGAALVFGLRGEQRQIAAGAGEDALAMLLEQRARTGALGAFLAQDFVLLRRQLRAPLRVGLFDLELLRGVCRGSAQPTEGGEAKQTGDRCEQDTAVNHDGLRAKRIWFVRLQIRGAPTKVTPIWRDFSHFLASGAGSPIRSLAPLLRGEVKKRPRLRLTLPKQAAADAQDGGGFAAGGAGAGAC